MKKITVGNLAEFKERVESKDLETVVEIFKGVKKGLEKNHKTVTIFDVRIEEDPSTLYKFKLERDQWPVALRACMNVFSEHDMFEECIEIQKMLQELLPVATPSLN